MWCCSLSFRLHKPIITREAASTIVVVVNASSVRAGRCSIGVYSPSIVVMRGIARLSSMAILTDCVSFWVNVVREYVMYIYLGETP